MLDYCEVGVSMGDGGPEILAMADMITDDVEEDGLYKSFKNYNSFKSLSFLAISFKKF